MPALRPVAGPAAALAAGLLLLGAAPAPAAARKPQRILSISQCTDMLLLELAPRERIAAVTYLARDAMKAVRPGAADGVPVNRGAAEDIVTFRPDLILAGDFSTPAAQRFARRIGARLMEVKSAASFDDIRAVTRQVGAAVGEPARAEALIAAMDRKLATLAARRPARPVRAAVFTSGAVPGRGTLANAIAEAAGAVNIAARLPDQRYSTFNGEALLRADPEVLLLGRSGAAADDLSGLALQHPAVRRRWRGRTLTFPEPLYGCGVPASADAAVELRAGLDRIAGVGRR